MYIDEALAFRAVYGGRPNLSAEETAALMRANEVIEQEAKMALEHFRREGSKWPYQSMRQALTKTLR